MRPLWSYVAQFPTTKGGQQRRLPTQIRLDLTWWNTLLPRFNGVLFFNDQIRDTFQLYTDASLKGLGGFFFHNPTKFWTEVKISQSEAFLAQTSNCATSHPLGPTVVPEESTSPSINVFEFQTILLAFQLFAPQWRHCKVIIYTDSTTAFSGLKAHCLRGPPNVPLRQIILCAAEYDVLLEPRWLESKANGLADALSRFNEEAIADLCPHWQNPLPSMLHHQPGCNRSEAPMSSKPYCGRDFPSEPDEAINQPSDFLNITQSTLALPLGPPLHLSLKNGQQDESWDHQLQGKARSSQKQ